MTRSNILIIIGFSVLSSVIIVMGITIIEIDRGMYLFGDKIGELDAFDRLIRSCWDAEDNPKWKCEEIWWHQNLNPKEYP